MQCRTANSRMGAIAIVLLLGLIGKSSFSQQRRPLKQESLYESLAFAYDAAQYCVEPSQPGVSRATAWHSDNPANEMGVDFDAFGSSVAISGDTPFGQNDGYIALRKHGQTEYSARHYREAQVLLEQALDAAQQANDSYEVALTYSSLGDVYQEQLRFEEAGQVYRKGIAILLREPGTGHALAIMWRNLASALIAETHYREAHAALDEASRLVQSHNLQDGELKARILNSRGLIYFYQRKLGKAKTHFSRAMQATLAAGDAKDPTRGDILHNLARAYHSSGQRAKAEETYKQALAIIESRLGPLHPNLVIALTNLGALCNDLGRYNDAEDYFQRTLVILEKSGKAFEETRTMEALHGLSRTYMLKHDPVRAEPLLSRAAEIARHNINQAIMIPEILHILDDYSKVLREMRRSVDADRIHAEAQQIRATAAFTVSGKAKW